MKLLLQTLLILLIIATFSICAIQPELHKNVIVYDSAYTLVPEQEVTTETNDIPVMEMPVKPAPTTTVIEKSVLPHTKTTKTQTLNARTQTVTKPKQTTAVKTMTTVKPVTETVKKPVTTTVTTPVVKEIKTVSPPKTEQKQIQPPVQTAATQKIEKSIEQPKVLTQQEETIAWNKWRSNLTNQIMHDTKLPNLPNGVLFQFSFNVDKYGKITNLQTGANPSNYTPYAIQYIAPVIRSYQGRSILNFPEGTARTYTQVTGKWRISATEKYSTPQDYNDLEKVVR